MMDGMRLRKGRREFGTPFEGGWDGAERVCGEVMVELG